MTIQTASAIVQRLGPCRVILDLQAHAGLARELSLQGCAVAAVADEPGRSTTAAFVRWASLDLDGLMRALAPLATLDALVLQSAGQDRAALEAVIFDEGWERHPADMLAYDYGKWSSHWLPELTFYRRATDDGCGALRDGVMSDGVLARYAMAGVHVRPGDHVLIDGMDATTGKAIVAAQSRAGRVDIADPGAVPDATVDLVIALEPPLPDGLAVRLADYARIVKPDGRIIMGFWPGEGDGEDVPADWDALAATVGQFFLPERRYVERMAGQGADGPHYLLGIAPEEPAEPGWLMIVASANPLAGEGASDSFDHPAFPAGRGPLPALVDFGAAYDNPWLYRAMVQMGERIADDDMLSRLAECVAEDSRPDSADRGAALAVLGYRVLESRRPDLAAVILGAIEPYATQPMTDATPVHVSRWCISLAFLAGRLAELAGDRATAKGWYRRASEADWGRFSPLLATKAIAAAFYEARIHLSEGDVQTALACFRHGSDIAIAAARFDHTTQMTADGQLLPFYLTELAEVIDMGSQCANAIAHAHLWERDPGLFWRQVDIRRFGLASWARDLERENAQLRAA